VSSFPAIIRRSVALDPVLAPVVFLMNLAARRETRAVARAVRGDAQ
jgi:hypothetical protein